MEEENEEEDVDVATAQNLQQAQLDDMAIEPIL